MTARDPLDLEPIPSIVSIGFFDGVHRGHQSILRRARRDAASGDLRTVALTFDRHPMESIAPDRVPAMLMTHARRFQTLEELGVDVVAALEFTPEVSRLEPDGFVSEFLVERLGARHVVVGENFRFGRRASGDLGTLSALGLRHGFSVDGVPILELAGVPISSTGIREWLASGDVASAARALGRAHLLEGPVVEGDRRGHALGVPTVNVAVDAAIQLPGHGIYAGHVRTPTERVPAAISVGVRPTFDGGAVTVEAHLLDWDGDLYGIDVAVEVRHRLRPEEAFSDTEALVAQMQRDIEETRALLGCRQAGHAVKQRGQPADT